MYQHVHNHCHIFDYLSTKLILLWQIKTAFNLRLTDQSWGDWQNTPMSVQYNEYSCMVPAIGVYIWERIGQETRFNMASRTGWPSVFHGKRTDTICIPQKLSYVECHILIVWNYTKPSIFRLMLTPFSCTYVNRMEKVEHSHFLRPGDEWMK